jgi:hypothetical protein
MRADLPRVPRYESANRVGVIGRCEGHVIGTPDDIDLAAIWHPPGSDDVASVRTAPTLDHAERVFSAR